MEKPQLTKLDLYCIARLIQNSFRAPDQETIKIYRCFYGCLYCKYAIAECSGPEAHYEKVFKKLRELTGIPLGTGLTLRPEDIGRVFLPGSYYLEHPEVIHELEKAHDPETVEGIKAYLGKIIARSKEESE